MGPRDPHPDPAGCGDLAAGRAGVEPPLRDPLAALCGHLARLRATALDGEQAALVDAMTEAVRQLLDALGAPVPAPRPAAGGGALVYVAEDDPATLEVTVEMLEVAGHRVEGFDDGAALLEAFARRPARAVILDAAMPVLDGIRCAAELRARQADLPILILTGFGEADLDLRGIPGRSPRVLSKPVPLEQLVAAISEALGDGA